MILALVSISMVAAVFVVVGFVRASQRIDSIKKEFATEDDK